MVAFHRLPLTFDPARLEEDLERAQQAQPWRPHFGRRALALRAAGGSGEDLKSRRGPFHDTAALEACPYFREVLDAFACEKGRVRLFHLQAGGHIRRHLDFDQVYHVGALRVHVPVVTSPEVEYYANDQRINLKPGEAWFIDNSFPHEVIHRGARDRVHLVIDCFLNDWLRAQLPPEFRDRGLPRLLSYRLRRARLYWRHALTGRGRSREE